MTHPIIDAPVVIVKLRNGTEVVGEMVHDDEVHIGLMNPMQINYKTIPGIPYPFVTFKHYMVFSVRDTPIPFRKHDVQTTAVAREAFSRFYRFSVMTDDQGDIDSQLDRAVDAQTRMYEAARPMTPEEKKELQQLNYRLQLERFDVKDMRKN